MSNHDKADHRLTGHQPKIGSALISTFLAGAAVDAPFLERAPKPR